MIFKIKKVVALRFLCLCRWQKCSLRAWHQLYIYMPGKIAGDSEIISVTLILICCHSEWDRSITNEDLLLSAEIHKDFPTREAFD